MAGSSRLCIPEIRDALLNTRPQRMAQSIDALRQQWTAAGQGTPLDLVQLDWFRLRASLAANLIMAKQAQSRKIAYDVRQPSSSTLVGPGVDSFEHSCLKHS